MQGPCNEPPCDRNHARHVRIHNCMRILSERAQSKVLRSRTRSQSKFARAAPWSRTQRWVVSENQNGTTQKRPLAGRHARAHDNPTPQPMDPVAREVDNAHRRLRGSDPAQTSARESQLVQAWGWRGTRQGGKHLHPRQQSNKGQGWGGCYVSVWS